MTRREHTRRHVQRLRALRRRDHECETCGKPLPEGWTKRNDRECLDKRNVAQELRRLRKEERNAVPR